MATPSELILEGGCDCGHIRYRVSGDPLIVHCCHCKWCQREAGSAFVINALFSRDRVLHLGAEPNIVLTPSPSGKGQNIARCPKCQIAVWSNYADGGDLVRFIRVGTLDEPHRITPDVHIFTDSKVPWLELPRGVPVFPQFYDPQQLWAKEADERRYAVLLEIREARTAQGVSA